MDPRTVWLSDNFRLSDFLSNHSVYARGYANVFEPASGVDPRIKNAEALCEHALEPLLETVGQLSISYGYISPDFSRRTVKYQDPDKPSHHRWDLGAAADVVAHDWVRGRNIGQGLTQLFTSTNTVCSPVLLAHAIAESGTPFSRLITYSESPYLCIAVSSREVQKGEPRKAFYENRYQGHAKAKPLYLQMSSAASRARELAYLQETGLPVPWEGAGYPTYHGGGINQYQHMRVSEYTTVLDWLFNLKSISNGVKNIPALVDDKVQDSFAAAGLAFDYLVRNLGLPRIRVERGYVCRSHPDCEARFDWRGPTVWFELSGSATPVEFFERALASMPDEVEVIPSDFGATFGVPVEAALSGLFG